MPATIKDLARQTGLSLATISKYLNGGKVKENNRIAIEKAIGELGFRVNQAARSLKTRRTKVIGFVIPELDNLFITSIVSTAESELRKHGYAVMISDCGNDPALEKEAVDFLIQRGAECIVNMPVSGGGEHLQSAIDQDIMVILIDRMINALKDKVDCVLVDNLRASYDATQCLLKKGHKEIAIIIGPREIYTSQQRLMGFFQAMLESGLTVSDANVYYSDYTIEGGYQSMTRLLKEHPEITGVFVTNYEMTMGAVLAMNEAGVSYPEQMSVIGFDNMILSRFVKPKLTTVSQPLKEIGRAIADRIIEKLEDQAEDTGKVIMLPTSLQEGESVRAPG